MIPRQIMLHSELCQVFHIYKLYIYPEYKYVNTNEVTSEKFLA